MSEPSLSFTAQIISEPDHGGAYIEIPYDIKQVFGQSRVKVHATFDGYPYDGSIVNMGVKNSDGSTCYLLGITKAIRQAIGKGPGDPVAVTIIRRPPAPVEQDPIGLFISRQDPDLQPRLNEIYHTFQKVLPQAQEKIAWGMPTFWDGGNIIHFCPFKNHIGIFPGGEATQIFRSQLNQLGLKYSKGTIQIPHTQPLPLDFLTELAQWCEEHNKK